MIEFFTDKEVIMIAGESMTIEDFINYVYPEDCPEKSILTIKLLDLVDKITL